MSDSQWEKVKDIFQAALEKPSGAEREQYLNEVCADDHDLRDEVNVLLNSFEEADDFLDESPIGAVAETIVGRRESLVAGQQFGRYRIERKLGAGGAGEVFLAFDAELERLVALKILSAEFSGNPDHIRRFLQEARAASALNHPNILTIFESGQIENVRFIAAEYVEGETLRERLRRAPADLGEILEIIAQTAAALNAAHRARIVHRDIKPENIMLRADGLVKVLDFGLAKLVEKDSAKSQNVKKTEFKTTPGIVMGTVAYMSPEQARGLPTDERTDVWSLGVCLSETVFGIQPFAGDTVSDQIAAILKSEPEPQDANAPPELQRIIGKCLEKKVENRYQTIGDLLVDINDLRQESDFSIGYGFSFVQTTAPLTTGETIRQNGKQTGAAPSVSSAEYVAGEIKKHKFFSLAAAFFAVAALGLILYFSAFNSFFFAKSIHSIAVLPFVNESGDADNEYLSDGLSESLINKLSQLPQLKVATRSSAFQYKNKTADTREIARALNVGAIVSGRVTRRGDDLQISIELINTAENTQIWGETYRRKVADAQTIQEEIAQIILQKLQIKPTGAEAQNFNSPITNNGQAYQLYLNGVFYRRKNGPENVKKAIEYQNQAIALDPNFALAYAELGFNYYNFVAVGAVDSQTGLPPARQAIEKALNLDETLAEAHDLNAGLKAAEFDWTGAETEIRRAIELNPNLASAHTYYSELLSETRRFDEALSEIRRARELDPLRINLVNYEAEILFRARRYDDALAIYESGNPEAVNETFALINRARVAAAKARYPEAIALLRKSLDKDETTMGLIHLGRIYALTGERRQAVAVLERLREIERLKEPDKYVSSAEIAILYAALEMREQAFASLEQAFAEHDLQLPLLNIVPEYDTLRDDPRFSNLLRRINLSAGL
ncbi:MAG: protein kinase [Pyrinomonadaceae bacterium]